VSSADIVAALNEMEERPWPGYFHGKGISAQCMATMLGKYGIKPRTRRSLGNKRGYKQEQFLDDWERYLPEPDDSTDLAATPLQRSNGGASSDSAGATGGLGVAPGNGLEPPSNKDCSTVAPKKGILPDRDEDAPNMSDFDPFGMSETSDQKVHL